MFNLALNAGHGYETAGKRCMAAIDPNETREYVLNKRICDKLEKRLSAYDGIKVLRIDNGTDIAISKRAKSANEFGADFYLAVHHNAGIYGGSGGGISVFTYLKVDAVTESWQRDIYNSLVKYTGLAGNRSNPLSKADLGECRETAMPAVLCECGFMDSAVDTPIILTDEFAEKAADALCEVIVKRAGASVKKTETVPDKPTSVPVSSAKPAALKSLDEIAKEVIAGRWGNGAERKTRLTEAGYDAAAIQKRVNELAGGSTAKKSINEIADEVIAGKWGNGAERKTRLTEAGYDAAAVQKLVNQILK